MKKETRTVVYDDELRMEAEHYVIGFVEDGKRANRQAVFTLVASDTTVLQIVKLIREGHHAIKTSCTYG